VVLVFSTVVDRKPIQPGSSGKAWRWYFPPWQTAYQFSLCPVARRGVGFFHRGRPHTNSAWAQWQGMALIFLRGKRRVDPVLQGNMKNLRGCSAVISGET
jgi:hypothetical protein